PHPAPYTVPIAFFQFLGIQIGSGMGPDLMLQKQFMAGKQYLPENIAILAKMPADGFHPQIIKTIETMVPILLDHGMSHIVEPEYNIPGWNDIIGFPMGHQMFQQPHQGSLPATHRTGEQDTLAKVHPEFVTDLLVPNEKGAHPVEHFPIFLMDLEILSEHHFSLGIQV